MLSPPPPLAEPAHPVANRAEPGTVETLHAPLAATQKLLAARRGVPGAPIAFEQSTVPQIKEDSFAKMMASDFMSRAPALRILLNELRELEPSNSAQRLRELSLVRVSTTVRTSTGVLPVYTWQYRGKDLVRFYGRSSKQSTRNSAGRIDAHFALDPDPNIWPAVDPADPDASQAAGIEVHVATLAAIEVEIERLIVEEMNEQQSFEEWLDQAQGRDSNLSLIDYSEAFAFSHLSDAHGLEDRDCFDEALQATAGVIGAAFTVQNASAVAKSQWVKAALTGSSVASATAVASVAAAAIVVGIAGYFAWKAHGCYNNQPGMPAGLQNAGPQERAEFRLAHSPFLRQQPLQTCTATA